MFFQCRSQWRSRAQLTLASAARMRSWRPSFDRRRRRAGRDKVRTFAVAQDYLLTRRAHRYRAARDEHAEAPVARPGEESRAAYRDQREGAANLHCRARAAPRSIEQQRPGAQRHLPAGIDKKPIDLQLRLFANPDCRIAAEPHSQSGRDAGRDFVAEKDRRGSIERAANRLEFGECLTLDVLDRADPLDGARRYADKDEWDCQRCVAEKPASVAGPVAFDLAEVGHRRSLVSLVFQGGVPIIVADASVLSPGSQGRK